MSHKRKRNNKKVKNTCPKCSPSCIYFHPHIESNDVQYTIVNGYKKAIGTSYYCGYDDKIIKKWCTCKHKKEYSDINTKIFKDVLIDEILEEDDVIG